LRTERERSVFAKRMIEEQNTCAHHPLLFLQSISSIKWLFVTPHTPRGYISPGHLEGKNLKNGVENRGKLKKKEKWEDTREN
jgi:hypothetical protein